MVKHGTALHTSGGLKNDDIVKRHGSLVSKKRSEAAKENPILKKWSSFVKTLSNELDDQGVTGQDKFKAIKNALKAKGGKTPSKPKTKTKSKSKSKSNSKSKSKTITVVVPADVSQSAVRKAVDAL